MTSPSSLDPGTRVVITAPNGGEGATQVVFVAAMPQEPSVTELMDGDSMADSPNVPLVNQASILSTHISQEDITEETSLSSVEAKPHTPMTLLDMNQFMEVVYTYKCKFCDHTTKTPEEMSNHVLSDHINTFQDSSVIAITDPPSELKVEESNLIDMDVSTGDHVYNATINSENTTVDNSNPGDNLIETDIPSQAIQVAQSLIMEVTDTSQEQVQKQNQTDVINETAYQEIFMCGQCSLSFVTMQMCKEHMSEVHNINIVHAEMETDEPEDPERISATERNEIDNKTSIGSQAMTYRKPGRKKKQLPQESNPDSVTQDTEEIFEIKEEIKDDLFPDDEEMALFSDEYLSQRQREGKRRIKVPKLLQDSYYVTKSKESKRYYGPRKPKEKKPEGLKCNMSMCKVGMLSEKSLDLHKLCHKEMPDGIVHKGYYCPYCTHTSMQWAPMRLHFWTKHQTDLDLLKCDICEFHTDAEHKLESHSLIHDKDKRYTCETCNETFSQLSQLYKHNAEHNENKQKDDPVSRVRWYKNRQCHICKKLLANSNCLKKHIEYVHEKVKTYVCDFCGHTAARKHMLQVHMRTHTGERPHKCDLCTFTTSDHNTLRRHRLRHTGEKPYHCQYCPYSCIQAISLKIHMKNKHQEAEGLFYCQACHYHTVNESYWLQHQEDHKNGLIEEQVNQKFVQEVEGGAGSKKKKGAISIKDVLHDLKIPSETPDTKEPEESRMVIIEQMGATQGEATIQEIHEITEVVPSDELVALEGGSNIQYVYYSQPDEEVEEDTQKVTTIVPATMLIQNHNEDTSTDFVEPIVSTLTEKNTITLTIQRGSDGTPQIIARKNGTTVNLDRSIIESMAGNTQVVSNSSLHEVQGIHDNT